MKLKRQRAQPHIESDSEGSWAISYGDLLTLLLTFFILFFSADKFIKTNKSKIDLAMKQKESDKMVVDIQKAIQPSVEVQDAVRAKVYQQGKKLFVEFFGVTFFKSGRIEVLPKGHQVLADFYQQYLPYMSRYNLAIRAFSDPRALSEPTRQRYKDNLQLSTLRSLEVLRTLQTQGVPLDKMRIQGYGELRLTQEDLEKISDEEIKRKPTALNDLARTIVLIIEPKEDL